jgi:hypothetical protein
MPHPAQKSARDVLLHFPFQIFVRKDQRAYRTAKVTTARGNSLIRSRV